MPELTNEQELTLRGELLGSFAKFAAAMTGEKWFDPTLHFDLCNHLQHGGNEILIVLPRSFLKTTYAGELFPLWIAIKYKYEQQHDIRILIVCNTAPNAEKSIHQIRSWVESHPLIQQLFSDIIPNFNSVRWSDRAACLARASDFPEATFEAAGVGTAIIRRHFDMIIEDDTIAPSKDALTGDEALPSKEDIEKAIGFHKLTTPLHIDPKTSRSVVIGTRWAGFDLINYIKSKEQYKVFDRPALVNGLPQYFRYDLEVLENIRGKMGAYLFSMLYLNQPLSSDQLKFKPEWIQYCSLLPEDGKVLVPAEGRVCVYGDPADPPTGKKTQDYSGIVVAKLCKEGIFVIDYLRKRLTEQGFIDGCLDFVQKHGAHLLKVELNKHASYEQTMRDEIKRRNIYVSFEGIKNTKKKEERILRLSPVAENKRLFLLSGMRELEAELFSFPRGEHDDVIDALSLSMVDYKGVDRVEPKKVKKVLDRSKFFPTFESITEELENKNRRNKVYEFA